jgi:DeoD family purine-nucleoside phosphorylase
MPHPIHLRPTAELARRVLLPGDPGRALLLAQALLEKPLMFNHHRGLWGYTGTAEDGEPLTIQSTGMGGPSAAIVVSELADLGADRFIRVGTCGSLADDLRLGSLVIASEALAGDGTSRALGAGERVAPDARLVSALRAAARDAAHGPVLSTDVFYGGERAAPPEAIAVEMEAAAIFQVATTRGLAAACVLVVTDELVGGGRERMDVDAVEAAGEAVGRAGAAALLAVSRRPPLRVVS